MRTADKVDYPEIRIKSADGKAFRIAADSVADYVLHPVFLRFLCLAILIYAMLDQRDGLDRLGTVPLVLMWSTIAALVALWLTFGVTLMQKLIRSGLITQIYTPVVLVPMVVLAGMAAQGFVVLFGGGQWQGLEQFLLVAGRDIIVVLLLDMMHGSFVVLAHPLARTDLPAGTALPPQPATTAEPEPSLLAADQHLPDQTVTSQHLAGQHLAERAPPAPAASDQNPSDRSRMVQIGTATVPLDDIQMIRTEDHYLGVTTRTGRFLQRAKMPDIPELHAGQTGMQINRSVWIAFSAIAHVTEGENRQITVKLVNGDEERVAKPRVYAFRQALQNHPVPQR